ncbi:MAG TPA: hypothetical protein PLZ45_13460 [Ferruginibacter sp.]|nr:hypothetical protein [Ferruginibacter sp.]
MIRKKILKDAWPVRGTRTGMNGKYSLQLQMLNNLFTPKSNSLQNASVFVWNDIRKINAESCNEE